jgi:alpha-L-fucosidase
VNRPRGSRPLSIGDLRKLISPCLQHCGLWPRVVAALAAWGCADQTGPVLSDTPGVPLLDPVPPLPSPDQLAWQTQELTAFLHFGLNTFSNTEVADGGTSPTIFNPTELNANQWMATFQSAGFRQATLTAKYQDGFCLWPSKCTTYSVAASPWLNGAGDVVHDFVEAAHEANIRVGLAIYPKDLHDPTYAVFQCQLTELLTNYGAIDEVWLWGEPPPGPAFDWVAIHSLVHQLQPHALVDIGNVVASVGADIRSVAQAIPLPPADQTSVQVVPGAASQSPVWYPAEALYSIRPGWFWHAAEDTELETLSQLVGFYYDSVGRNSVLLLNVPPNTQGLIADPDVAELAQFGPAIPSIYQSNLVEAQPASADSVFQNMPTYAASMAVDGNTDTFWAAGEGTTSARIEFDLGSPRTFNLVSIQEPIALGERATQHQVEVESNGSWTTIATGTAIGQRKLHRVGAVTASSIALVITQARGVPAIAEFGVYQSPYP